MDDPTLQQLEDVQSQLEELLGFVKSLLELGDALDARLFDKFMRDFRAMGEMLDPKVARDIRRELRRRNRAQQRMLPLIMSAVDVETRIKELKAEIEREETQDKKKRLHKRKIIRIILIIIVDLILALFAKAAMEETERLTRKLSI